jgi:hypothetical protein
MKRGDEEAEINALLSKLVVTVSDIITASSVHVCGLQIYLISATCVGILGYLQAHHFNITSLS